MNILGMSWTLHFRQTSLKCLLLQYLRLIITNKQSLLVLQCYLTKVLNHLFGYLKHLCKICPVNHLKQFSQSNVLCPLEILPRPIFLWSVESIQISCFNNTLLLLHFPLGEDYILMKALVHRHRMNGMHASKMEDLAWSLLHFLLH
jgi:hypothetical protein